MGAETRFRSPHALVERLRSLSILPGRRMCGLRAVLGGEGVLIYRTEVGDDVRVALGNVHRCGRRECPVCGPIVAASTYAEIRRAGRYLQEAGAWQYLVTLTVAHSWKDPADQVWNAVSGGLNRILSGADRQTDWDELAIIGQWVRIENRSTRAGHHIHAHMIVWTEREVPEPDDLLERWFPRWRDGATAAGLPRAPALHLQHATRIEIPDAVAAYVAKAEEAIANELTATEVKPGHRRDSQSQVELAWSATTAARAERFRLHMTKHQQARMRDGRIEIQSSAGLIPLEEKRDDALEEESEQLSSDLALLDDLVGTLQGERRDAIDTRRAALLRDLADAERRNHPAEPHLVRFELRSMIARQPIEDADAEINEAGSTRAAELRAARRLRDETRTALLMLGPRMVHEETGEIVAPNERGQHFRWVPIEEYVDAPIPAPVRRMWQAELAAHRRRRVRRSIVQKLDDDDHSDWARRRRLWNAAIAASKSDEALDSALYELAGRRWEHAEDSGVQAQAQAEFERAATRREGQVDRRYAHRYAVLLPLDGGEPMRRLDAEAIDEIRVAATGEPAELIAVAQRHGFEAVPARNSECWPAPKATLLKSYFYTPEERGAKRCRARAASADHALHDCWPLEAQPVMPEGYRVLDAEEERRLLRWRRSVALQT